MRIAGTALALFLLAPTLPAAAQTAEEDYQAGVAARRAGDPAEALRRLERAVAAEPENADIHLQIGFARLALGALDEAEAAFRRTLALAPDYEDARSGLALVTQARRDAAARTEADMPPVPEVAEPPVPAAAAAEPLPWRWRVDVDGSYTSVEGGTDWQGATVSVQHQVSRDTLTGLIIEPTRRFERTDVYAEARVEHRFAPGSVAYVLAGGTPEADHRPRWQVGGGASVRTHGGPWATVLRLDVRQAEYASGDVQTATPGIEQYLGGSAWITLQWINVWDRFTHSAGWLARGDAFVTGRLRLFAGLADAPDLSEGVVIDTFSLFGGLSLDVGDRTTLRASIAHDDVETGSDRLTVALGAGVRF